MGLNNCVLSLQSKLAPDKRKIVAKPQAQEEEMERIRAAQTEVCQLERFAASLPCSAYSPEGACFHK